VRWKGYDISRNQWIRMVDVPKAFENDAKVAEAIKTQVNTKPALFVHCCCGNPAAALLLGCSIRERDRGG
jgi:hypothetical protein